MNERLPYEEQISQQWDDLSLPDENLGWDDMKRRLEEDDDDGIIPIWLRGCGLWGLLSIVLLGFGWWMVRPDKWWNKTQSTEKTIPIKTVKESGKDKQLKDSSSDTFHITTERISQYQKTAK